MTQQQPIKRIYLSRCLAVVMSALFATLCMPDAHAAAGKPFSLESFHQALKADPVSPTPPADADAAPTLRDEALPFDDPIEPVNRAIHGFNRLVFDYVIDPTALVVIDNTSAELRNGIFNVMENLREPITVSSALIEGDVRGAGSAATRFLINSTIGVLGYYDVAREQGYERQARSVEQALCRQNVPGGPYIVMPVLGSATIRDAAGRLATMYVQYMVLGLAVIPYRAVDIISHYIDRREEIRAADDMLLDNYAGYRSIYGQALSARCAEVDHAETSPIRP
ncbi:MAG: VacJ family lipoprotein [Alphaproteobacteria bacterium]|nr:VacJ family lipoprotein [Alphaproteobacteria bacterium]MBU0797350.1 VacJ family lipoprotein [Alphaproteobacteria bacterium]MBU0886882.1 VacJ family lipoprotein [Alphaproteobacteria bacterium]MBU1812375.1 VacJ family lipoprotein [Alphaproteobacteria bacterium]